MKRPIRERWLEVAASDGSILSIRVVDIARARHLRLSLGREGPRLSKPRWVSLSDAAAFAAEKREWLEARLAERQRQVKLLDWPELRTGATGSLTLRGSRMHLRVDVDKHPSLQLDDAGLWLCLPDRDPATRRRIAAGLFRSWLETEMRRDLTPLLTHHVAALGRAPTRLSIRVLRSLWGSLSARDHLSLDLALILAPTTVLEYVLVHELAHLFERNHGPRFWARVTEMLPDYRERQQHLRSEGEALKNGLARLLGHDTA